MTEELTVNELTQVDVVIECGHDTVKVPPLFLEEPAATLEELQASLAQSEVVSS